MANPVSALLRPALIGATLALATVPLATACSSDDGNGGGSAGQGAAPTGGNGPDAGSGGLTTSSSSSSSAGATGGGGSGASGGSGGGSTVVPPLGGSSQGSGGPVPVAGSPMQAGAISYTLVVPSSLAHPAPLLVAYSGTEGVAQMTTNLVNVGPMTGTSGFIRAVLDGMTYYGDGSAGATVLDALRGLYDVDNDRTYLLGESAGTTAALQLGFDLRQSYFAAYWANDVNAAGAPASSAAELGFAPWGQVGPGGDFADAQQIVAAMQAAGYRLPSPAPYAGTGSDTHGSPDQFIAAVSWFPGKSRQ